MHLLCIFLLSYIKTINTFLALMLKSLQTPVKVSSTDTLRTNGLNFFLYLFWDISHLFRDKGYWGKIILGYLQKLLWDIGILGVFIKKYGIFVTP